MRVFFFCAVLFVVRWSAVVKGCVCLGTASEGVWRVAGTLGRALWSLGAKSCKLRNLLANVAASRRHDGAGCCAWQRRGVGDFFWKKFFFLAARSRATSCRSSGSLASVLPIAARQLLGDAAEKTCLCGVVLTCLLTEVSAWCGVVTKDEEERSDDARRAVLHSCRVWCCRVAKCRVPAGCEAMWRF